MTTDNVLSEATRIHHLVPHLTLEDVEDAILRKLKSVGREYKVRYQLGTPEQRRDASSAFVTTTYDIARVFENDRELYDHFPYDLYVHEEEGEHDPEAVEIFESVLIYALDSRSRRRWRDYASKIARIFDVLSKEGLSSNDVVSRFEGVGGIEKFI